MLRIPRVVSKVKLIQKIDILCDTWLVRKPMLKRKIIPSAQIVLFRFFAGRLSSRD